MLLSTVNSVNGPSINADISSAKDPFDMMSKISSTAGSNSGLSNEFIVLIFSVYKIINAISLSLIVLSGLFSLIAYGISKKTQNNSKYKIMAMKCLLILFCVASGVFILNNLIAVICFTFGLKQV